MLIEPNKLHGDSTVCCAQSPASEASALLVGSYDADNGSSSLRQYRVSQREAVGFCRHFWRFTLYM